MDVMRLFDPEISHRSEPREDVNDRTEEDDRIEICSRNLNSHLRAICMDIKSLYNLGKYLLLEHLKTTLILTYIYCQSHASK